MATDSPIGGHEAMGLNCGGTWGTIGRYQGPTMGLSVAIYGLG